MDKQTQKNLLNLVKKNYDEITEEFDITRKKKPWPEISALAENVKDGDLVIDIGCGNGRLIDVMGNKRINYLGLDSNQKLIEAAEKNYKTEFPDFKFELGDILELGKIPQINFDWVFCIAVLHHLPGKDLRIQALKQLRNKVADNGKIIITVWNLWSQPKFRNLIFKYFFLKILKRNKMDAGDIIFEWKKPTGEGISERYYHAFTKFGLRSIVKKTGLKIEKIYKDQYNYYLVLTK